MAFFQSQEKRRRHTLIDNTIGELQEVLDINDSGGGKISKVLSDDYRLVLDRLVVPNVRHGTMQIAKRALHDENFIPIWVLSSGETVRTEKVNTLPMHDQKLIIRKKLTNPPDWKRFLELQTPSAELRQMGPMSDSAGAIVQSIGYKIGAKNNPIQTLIRGRPFVFLNITQSSTPRVDALTHELTHVRQNTQLPVVRCTTYGDYYDDQLLRELEAYSHEGSVLDELARQGMWNNNYRNSHYMIQEIIDAAMRSDLDENGQVILNENFRKNLILSDLGGIAYGLTAPEAQRNLPFA